MNSLQSKIESVKKLHSVNLNAEIETLEHEDHLSTFAPAGFAPEGYSHHKHDGVDVLRYTVKNAEAVSAIISAYHAKYGSFLPIGKYAALCAIVTAYPWKEYTKPEALKHIEDDAVEARNHKGKGFSSIEFAFYPKIEGQKVCIKIDLAFRCYVQGFEGMINANYDRNGNIRTVQKTKPPAFNAAAFMVSFGGGGEDTADWRGIFNRDAILTALEVSK